MKAGFQQSRIRVWTGDGLNDILYDYLDYIAKDGTQYRCPIGGTTDGLSVPRAIQNIIPASGNDSWMCGVLHDSAYRGQLLEWEGEVLQGWRIATPALNPNRGLADLLILEAMELQGVGWLRRKTIYRALRLFGQFAWNDNRSPAGLIRNKLQPVNYESGVNSHYDGDYR